VIMDKTLVTLKVQGNPSHGWHLFRCAPPWLRIQRPADEIEKDDYLKCLPVKANVRLFYEEDGIWFGAWNDEIIPIHLVEGAERFDVVRVASDHTNWYYWEPAGIGFDQTPVMLEMFKAGTVEKAKFMTPTDLLALAMAVQHEKARRKKSVEELVGDALLASGGKLMRLMDQGDHLVIEWKSRAGNPYFTRVRKTNFQVVNAGICLNGTDKVYDLTALGSVVAEGERRKLIYRVSVPGTNGADSIGDDDDDGDDDEYDW